MSDATRSDTPVMAGPSLQHIALLGLMASGKSTVGRGVARRLGWTFVDVDDVIEASTGSTVAELWESGGEEAFRGLERAVVVEALTTSSRNVLAAPGGVVIDPVGSEAIRAAGVLAVYLRASPALLAGRIKQDGDHPRPLVDHDPDGVMERMFSERDDSYRALADHTIDIDKMTADQVVHAVLHLAIRQSADQRG